MKMIVTILNNEVVNTLAEILASAGFTTTHIDSTGGFFREGNSTLMVGVDDDQVEEALQLIRENSSSSVEPILRKATVFVLDVEHFEQI